MDAVSFGNAVVCRFNELLKPIAEELSAGRLTCPGQFSFPTTVRIAETSHHLIAEFSGCTTAEQFAVRGLRPPTVIENFHAANDYFNGGFSTTDGIPTVVIEGHNIALIGITICSRYDEEMYRKKINHPIEVTPRLRNSDGQIPLMIDPGADRLLFIDVIVIRTDDVRILFRVLEIAFCVRASIEMPELSSWLESSIHIMPTGYVLGMNQKNVGPAESLATQLCSLSNQLVSERIIDDFLQAHGEYFVTALGYKRSLSQCHLEWTDRTDTDPVVSIPDYLLERHDGFWDILDIKKALLKFPSVVLGVPSRPRFIAYVTELIAQLQQYHSYFDNKVNATWAEEKYGVKVSNPKLIGLVGNYNSFDTSQVKLALRPYRENIVVMSYTDVVSMLRKQT